MQCGSPTSTKNAPKGSCVRSAKPAAPISPPTTTRNSSPTARHPLYEYHSAFQLSAPNLRDDAESSEDVDATAQAAVADATRLFVLLGWPESSAQARADHIADALARIHATATKEPASAKKPKGGAENAPVQYPVWAFVVTWTELDQWRTHYDPAVLAVELTGEHVATFLRVIEHTVAFADALQSALANPSGATASGTVDVNDERGDEPAGGRPQLRAI